MAAPPARRRSQSRRSVAESVPRGGAHAWGRRWIWVAAPPDVALAGRSAPPEQKKSVTARNDSLTR